MSYLPSVFLELAPELEELPFPAEERATCASCRMFPCADDPPGRRTFAPGVACCTYQPRLANFLVGRRLRAGGDGAAALEKRIEQGGLLPKGIEPPLSWSKGYAAGSQGGKFGQADFVRCPYLSKEMTCTVWEDRGAVCRTWFCAHDNGPRGAALWRTVKALLWDLEGRIARYLIRTGSPPAEGASAAAWTAWYLWCAERVDSMVADDVHDPVVDQLRDDLLAAWSALEEPLPEVLAPELSEWHVGDGVLVHGYSAYDAVKVPADLFVFLSRLDGEMPWLKAIEGTDLNETHVRELVRVAALVVPSDAHEPSGVELAVRMRTPDGKWVTLDPE